jgi:hypothetical protein
VFKLLVNGLSAAQQQACIENYDIDGLCCSYAMHYAKERLTDNRTANDYSTEPRLMRLGHHQSVQNIPSRRHSEAGKFLVAKSYGLSMGFRPVFEWHRDAEPTPVTVPSGVGLCYISITLSGRGHGWAMDFRDSSCFYLADSGSGVYAITEETKEQAIGKHVKALETVAGNFELLQLFSLTRDRTGLIE